ncbi:MAG TPA: GNAT family N-acetyltransferase [Pelobium sp.]|nr:GNAT family N-acetyltransferase [Pelobium sp.]
MIKAGSQDKNLVVDILTKAFDTNKSANYIVKQDSKRIKRLEALMDYSFEMCHRFGKVYLSDDKKACALILYPDKKTALNSILLDLKLILKTIGIENIGKALKRESAIKAIQPKTPIYYLWFIGVDPKLKNQGIGTNLLSDIIAESENEKRPVYLETSTLQNLPFYEKFGFRTYHELDFSYKLFFLKRDLKLD